VSAACLAELGHRVIGVDRDEHKVRSVNAGRAPFFEPGLTELVRKNVGAKRLSASTSLTAALAKSDIALVCVGTPSERNGNLGLDQLRRVAAEIKSAVRAPRRLIVAIRSTVFPGTCDELFENTSRITAVSNPEFLREGTAVRDFMEPSLLVVGGSDEGAVGEVADLYAGLPAEPCLVSLRTAEMIKYACNAFHAVKISFANEIGTLCAHLGISSHEVMETLCRDVKLNVSPAYLKPGFAFGGSCLPKDLRALVYRASRLDLSLPLIESTLPSNDEHLSRAIDTALELPAGRIGLFGLAFKENTDDLRESPVVALAERLLGKGRDVKIFDPHIKMDQIYGTNRSFVLSAIPHIGKLMVGRVEELLEWAEYVVVTQRPAARFMERIQATGVPVLDLASDTPAPRRTVPALAVA
jgi:GDP-mannose 6-dehydrogenase